MSLDEFRQYLIALHYADADRKGIHAQILYQKNNVTPWYPQAVFDEMESEMLRVDSAALQYPFAKVCMNSFDVRVLTNLFRTPEGQAYLTRTFESDLKQEGAGTSATAARTETRKEDSGLPGSAFSGLSEQERQRAIELLGKSNVLSCLKKGFSESSDAVADERTSIRSQIIHKHQAEIDAAKLLYDASHNHATQK